MASKRTKKSTKEMSLPVLHPDAAGADVGAEEIYVAVPAGRDTEPVRSFKTFTEDLRSLVDWLEECGIRTVAMESTSVYWIPLCEILEERGIDVCLVNARHVKNVPGRKSDVADCQWLQYLHAVGLLRGGFRPARQIRALRTLRRHRESLVQMASEHILHVQKALDQMNLQIHHVLSDITGVSGLAILEAILAGERDALTLARLCHPAVKSSQEVIVKALEGDYREEHLFTLRQSLNGYRYHQGLVTELDREIERQLRQLPPADPTKLIPPPGSKAKAGRSQHNAPQFDLRGELYRLAGVDLTQVPGISAQTAHTILTEIGPDVSRFRSASAFASFLGLCPDRRISGGKLLSTRTRPVKSRTALALRIGAQALHHAKGYMGEYFRRMKRKLGAPQAITATAHKLARVVYHLLRTKEPYCTERFAQQEQASRQRVENRLRRQARELGFDLARAVPRTA